MNSLALVTPAAEMDLPHGMHRALDRIHRFVDGPSGAAAGAAIYGAWAFWANLSAGVLRAAAIAAAHATVSFVLTFVGVKVMTRLFAWGGPGWRGGCAALFGALVFDYSLLIGTHLSLARPTS